MKEHMKGKYKSRESSVETVRHLFQNTEENSISLKEAYTAWGRDLTKESENKAWLANKLTSLKYHNLINPIYTTSNNRRVLNEIQLTVEGKRAIGKIGDAILPDQPLPLRDRRTVTIEDIMKAIPRLRKENPEFDILFKVTPKEL